MLATIKSKIKNVYSTTERPCSIKLVLYKRSSYYKHDCNVFALLEIEFKLTVVPKKKMAIGIKNLGNSIH